MKKMKPVLKLTDEQQQRMITVLEDGNHHDIVDALLGKPKVKLKPVKKTDNATALFYTVLFIMTILLILFYNHQ